MAYDQKCLVSSDILGNGRSLNKNKIDHQKNKELCGRLIVTKICKNQKVAQLSHILLHAKHF
jgi:hypothetical protein